MCTQVCDVKYGPRRGVFSEEAENVGDFARCGMGIPQSMEEKRGARAENNWVWNQEKGSENRG